MLRIVKELESIQDKLLLAARERNREMRTRLLDEAAMRLCVIVRHMDYLFGQVEGV